MSNKPVTPQGWFFILLLFLCSFAAQSQTSSPKCGVITTKGTPCKRIVKAEGFKCSIHDKKKILCSANTKHNQPCRMPVKKVGDKCRFHKD